MTHQIRVKLLKKSLLVLFVLPIMTYSQEVSTVSLNRQIDSLVKQMTLEEKISMIKSSGAFTNGGVPRLGIPSLVMSDGPHGVRHEHNWDWSRNDSVDSRATFLPSECGLAATWNTTLALQYGKVLGSEANKRGKDIILGPGVNIVRTPLNGRNFEYLSEDPFLTSVMGVHYIKGVQSQGISACVKHYLANNQETKRQEVSVQMSERALREIYLPAFQAAVKEGQVHAVMGAYNKFRGQYCAHHEYLVSGILKKEFGFRGVLISDWSAVMNSMEALRFGTDIEMGTEMRNWGKWNFNAAFMGDTALALIRNGAIPESLVDEKVKRILWVMHQNNTLNKANRKSGNINTPEHQKTARQVAEESIVLLKNANKTLPLNKKNSIAVIGDNAIRLHAEGGGSAQVLAFYEINPMQGLKNALQKDSSLLKFCQGYESKKEGGINQKLIDEAVKAAKQSDVAIIFGGFNHGYSNNWNDLFFDTEGKDKPDIQLPFGQNELIKAVAKANPNTIVVLYGGSACEMPWIKEVKAVLQVWYPGMEGGNAIADILFGIKNPSGKLPVTFPVKLSDIPAHHFGEFPGDSIVEYKEGILVGYRYFDTYAVKPLFAFGHGLSYTTFSFSNLKIFSQNGMQHISVVVKNTGNKAGAEVVQVYVSDVANKVQRPKKELKGFSKVFLQPGEEKEVQLDLPLEAFQYFNEKENKWKTEAGKYSILVGSSSNNIAVQGLIEIK